MITRAAEILRRGGLVAFPTETVYGLGADATNADAVARIFTAKGRPATNPLIVHVADLDIARRYAGVWTDLADRLAARFWPGPLTLVVPSASTIAERVRAGGPTVGLRVPAHPVALQLLRAFDGPVAAPSANRSEHVSPTLARHVIDDLGGRVDLVLDGGPCGLGIESTVVDITGTRPRVLRPGSVTVEQIEAVAGPVDRANGMDEPGRPAMSPGRHAKHYAPRTPAYWFQSGERDRVLALAGVGVMAFERAGVGTVIMPADPADYARCFYQSLREADALGRTAICIEMPPDLPEWAAVRDRLSRAAVPFHSAEAISGRVGED
jgi:L-threonylcarbamoyladenylate synthase